MQLLKQLRNRLTEAFKRATEGPKLDLSIDDQWARIEKHIQQENATHEQKLQSLYTAGWFKLIAPSGAQHLRHYCPRCKTLSEGPVAIHCGKREKRPEGWKLLFLDKAPPKFI